MTLTAKQRRILHLKAQGAMGKEICDALKISASTLKGHLLRLQHKFGASNTTRLVVLFVQMGTRPKGRGKSAV